MSNWFLEYKWRVFAVSGLSTVVVALSSSSVTIAMPVMAAEFGVNMAAIGWMSLGYSLISCCTLLIFGRLADLYGYKRQFIIGLVVFGLACLLMPILSRGLEWLIFFRVAQGLGNGILMSIAQAQCVRAFQPDERGKVLGLYAMVVSVAQCAGPTLGGLLIAYFDWRSIFYFKVPFCILGIIMGALYLKKDEPPAAQSRRMDWLGSAFFAVFIGSLTFAVNMSAEWGVADIRFLICLAVCLVSLVCFIRWENYTDMPLMKLDFFKNPYFFADVDLSDAVFSAQYLAGIGDGLRFCHAGYALGGSFLLPHRGQAGGCLRQQAAVADRLLDHGGRMLAHEHVEI
jgi:MFS family permease